MKKPCILKIVHYFLKSHKNYWAAVLSVRNNLSTHDFYLDCSLIQGVLEIEEA